MNFATKGPLWRQTPARSQVRSLRPRVVRAQRSTQTSSESSKPASFTEDDLKKTTFTLETLYKAQLNKAESGDAEAQFALSKMIGEGLGVARNSTESVSWLQKSASQGNENALLDLGAAEVKQDVPEGLNILYKLAQEKQNVNAALFAMRGFKEEGPNEHPARAYQMCKILLQHDKEHAEANFNMGLFKYSGHGTPQDYHTALHYFLKCTQQFPSAFFYLGEIYLKKAKTEPMKRRNYIKYGMDYLSRGALENSPEAQFELGKMLCDGDIIPKDINLGVQWIEEAAKHNFPDANYVIGFCHEKGILNYPKNPAKALEYYSHAARLRHSESAFRLAMMLKDGTPKKDYEKNWHDWLRIAARKRHPKAKISLAKEFLLSKDPQKIDSAIKIFSEMDKKGFSEATLWKANVLATGNYVPQNKVDAKILYDKLAKVLEQNYVQKEPKKVSEILSHKDDQIEESTKKLARVLYAECLLDGNEQEHQKGIITLQQLMDEKDVDAEVRILHLFFAKNPHANILVPANYKIYELASHAAQQGHPDGQNFLGICLFSGTGTKKNEAEAVKYFELASQTGLPAAQYFLGMCYLHGIQKSKNVEQATEMFKSAATAGNQQAWKQLEQLGITLEVKAQVEQTEDINLFDYEPEITSTVL